MSSYLRDCLHGCVAHYPSSYIYLQRWSLTGKTNHFGWSLGEPIMPSHSIWKDRGRKFFLHNPRRLCKEYIRADVLVEEQYKLQPNRNFHWNQYNLWHYRMLNHTATCTKMPGRAFLTPQYPQPLLDKYSCSRCTHKWSQDEPGFFCQLPFCSHINLQVQSFQQQPSGREILTASERQFAGDPASSDLSLIYTWKRFSRFGMTSWRCDVLRTVTKHWLQGCVPPLQPRISACTHVISGLWM